MFQYSNACYFIIIIILMATHLYENKVLTIRYRPTLKAKALGKPSHSSLKITIYLYQGKDHYH